MSKIIKNVVAGQLINFLESNNLFHQHQFGFRPQHSETVNCYFWEKMRQSLDQGYVLRAVFIVLKKAFDTVNHTILVSKLGAFNFSNIQLSGLPRI